ncbi:MAG: 5-formyltetrahydrofolate cyclo-ligase [Elusimicrobia bacterium]|nr:5-formyltetrahydrofolate cyclo-ligase [Elusimicrobiota bacterium]
MNKQDIRKKILAIREEINKKEVDVNSEKILKKLFKLREFCDARRVSFYVSFKNEVDTRKMIESSLKLKKDVFLPKIVKNKLMLVKIKDLKNLVSGKYGILEPETKGNNLKNNFNLDAVIVPGVVFDKQCNRIGFGKGYFDKFLKNISTVKIGLSHSFQVLKRIPVSEKDVPMDFVITEKRIFRRNACICNNE